MRTLGPIVALALASAGCASARRGEPVGKPVEISSEQQKRGELVFMRNCNECHPGGNAGVGPALNNRPVPGAAIKLQVREGLGAMPAFGPDKISDSELDDLVAYLETLRHS